MDPTRATRPLSPMMSPIRRRRRPALSCQECRRRKIRCDHNNPCAHCTRQKTKCVYKPFTYYEPSDHTGDSPVSSISPRPTSTTATASPPPTTRISLPTPLSRVLSRQTVETTPATQDASFLVPVTTSQDVELPSPNQDGQHRNQRERDPSFCGLINRIAKLEESVAARKWTGDIPASNVLSEPSKDRRPLHVEGQQLPGTQDWQPLQNKPRDWGRTRWVGDTTEFAVVMACYAEIVGKNSKNPAFQTPDAAALIAQAAEALQGCKNRAKSIKVARPTRGLPSPYACLAPPSLEGSDEDGRALFYLLRVHRLTPNYTRHRILHAPTFWAEYHKYWDHPGSVSEDARHRILLVIGIGSSVYDHGDIAAIHRNTESVHQWIYAAETWLSGPLEKDRLDVKALQIHCLTVLARQIFSIGGDTVWVSMGSLLHGAMQIGLHRDPKNLPDMSLLQAELRRRLWATILDLIVQSSLDAWMPPRLSLEEFDTELPANVNDDEISETTTTLQPHPKETFTSTSLQLALSASLPTRLGIVQFLNNLNSDRSYHRALALTAELTASISANSTLFAPNNRAEPSSSGGSSGDSSGDSSSNAFHRSLLDYLTRRFLIPLHIPFSHQARTNPLFHYSLKVSLDAALALVSHVPEEGNDRFGKLISIAGGMLRDGLRYATSAISLELLSHVETQLRDGSLPLTSHTRTTLTHVLERIITLAEARIRRGETNVKIHMFLRMVLAQVRAVESRVDENDVAVAVAVARAARDSLRFSEGWSVLDGSPGDEGGFDGLGMEAMQGFDFDGFGEEFAWESFFPDGRFS
ncbi:uncharacterized protein B0H64DRAFT_454636 [Chaetomium fimeti]|uniref:Zn(2)-C6 fungal-type domain-containing protein n=1 Tax=Chaetomium fimeti TaxID=1854472 RepID=A0AAE0HNN1_9PEZI|nr:hypothetical protein B0H64DRAFT_454636 [Chaetomium fimeti]